LSPFEAFAVLEPFEPALESEPRGTARDPPSLSALGRRPPPLLEDRPCAVSRSSRPGRTGALTYSRDEEPDGALDEPPPDETVEDEPPPELTLPPPPPPELDELLEPPEDRSEELPVDVAPPPRSR
jgi:hypothetical protein